MTVSYRCTFHDCPDGGLTFDNEREWKDHLDEKHPITCTSTNCRNLAAYRYNPGAPGSYYYCAECADRSWDENETMRERIRRVTRTANENTERLPHHHPLERRLRKREAPS